MASLEQITKETRCLLSCKPQLRNSDAALLEKVGRYLMVRQQRNGPRFPQYATDPVGFCRDILGVTLWDKQAEAILALLKPPYRVSVDSGHNIGKTFLAACTVIWWYETRNPCWVITTAPTERDVVQLLWTEVRLLRQRAKVPLADDLMPAAPHMQSGPEHAAMGYTARDANSAHGRHRPNMLFIFDEKEGVAGAYWDGLSSMLRPGSGDAALAIGNPLTTTTRAYREHQSVDARGNPTWHRFSISSLDHPNLRAGLRGDPLPIPQAVTPGQVEQWLVDWCDPVAPGDEQAGDIRWPPEGTPCLECLECQHALQGAGSTDGTGEAESGLGELPGLAPCSHCAGTGLAPATWFRPGPIGQPRILGQRPASGTFGVWSEALWRNCFTAEPLIPLDKLPVIGCDCATYGMDYTAFHVRCGPVSLYHQAVNGWEHDRIAHRLMELAGEYAAWHQSRLPSGHRPIDARDIEIRLDDDATGRAVATILERKGYRVRRMNASSAPQRPDLYARVRDELWFMTAKKAAIGQVYLSRLDRVTRQRLELQALAPMWWPTDKGQRQVESKDDLRKAKRMGRSPDDMDALNLAYAEDADWTITVMAKPAAPAMEVRQAQQRATGRRMMG